MQADGVFSPHNKHLIRTGRSATVHISPFSYLWPNLAGIMIRIFITGGTFDKEYNELNGELYFKDTHMQELLEKGRCRLDTQIRTLMMIDSLEMTEEDRELIAHQCTKCE